MEAIRNPFPNAESQSIPHGLPARTDPSQDNSSQSFNNVLHKLAHEVDQGERVVRTALRGNPYNDDAKGMIALQAGVYRYVEAVELCTKLVDRTTAAVRTTLQNQ